MKKIRFVIFSLLMLAINFSTFSKPIYISTGSKVGNYYKFGKDLENNCSNIINIRAKESKGSLENIKNVYKDEDYVFGITQGDAYYLATNIEPKILIKVKKLTPLYKEYIYVLVKKNSNIYRIKDLNNKRVSIGKIGSGSWITGRSLKNVYNISFIEKNFDINTAISKLKNNEIDAVIYVGGKYISPLMGIKKEDNIRMLDFSRDYTLDYLGLYYKDKLEEGVYPFLNRDMVLYTVHSYLIAKNGKNYNKYVNKLKKCFISKKNVFLKLDKKRKLNEKIWESIYVNMENFLNKK